MLFCLFLISDFYLLITAVISQIFYSNAELEILKRVPINEGKTKFEAYLVTIETSDCFM